MSVGKSGGPREERAPGQPQVHVPISRLTLRNCSNIETGGSRRKKRERKYSLQTEATEMPEIHNGRGPREGPGRQNRRCSSDFLEVQSSDKGCSLVMVTSHCGQR